MFDIFTRTCHAHKRAVYSTGLCGECVGTDLGCCGSADAIPGVAQFVFGVFVDFLAAFCVLVVKDFSSAQVFVQGKVLGGCCAYDFVS
jgi:hypothetical protein